MTDLPVQLFCYDLSNGMAANLSLALIGRQLEGIWHTAIVVYGKEFFFDGGVGIVSETPRKTRFGEPVRVDMLGTTGKKEEEFLAWVQQQHRSGFGPGDYSLLNRNCNHFTQEAARFLVGRDIPDDIRNMIPLVLETPLGKMLRPTLEANTTAPAGGSPAPPLHNPGKSRSVEVTNTGLLSAKKQLTVAEEDDLMNALAMLRRNKLLTSRSLQGFDATHEALTFLRSILRNILRYPTESKYRTVFTDSASYRKHLLPLEKYGVADIFRLSGFRLSGNPSKSRPESYSINEDGSESDDSDEDGSGSYDSDEDISESYDSDEDGSESDDSGVDSEEIRPRWYLSSANKNESILKIMISHVDKTIEAIFSEALCKTKKPLTVMKDAEVISEERMFEEAMLHDAGRALDSLAELLAWQPTKSGPITPAVPCRSRVVYTSEQRSRLIICHDMMGGYLPGDYPRFELCGNPSSQSRSCCSAKSVVDTSYTVNYWHLVDYFIYFAYRRVSIPPKEWINAAHREGVPMLGTFISEHEGLDIRFMLHNAKETSATIERLVDICNAYNFDGYLVTIRTPVSEDLVKRMVTFVEQLRKTLNERRPESAVERVVIWNNSLTIYDKKNLQTALTVETKPFFDAGDGVFVDWAWKPNHLNFSAFLVGDRARDVYMGVDVFGRGGMFAGGGFNSGDAVRLISAAKLSALLFAPGWTCECQGNNKRETFLRSDARMWSGLQEFFSEKHVEYNTLPVWTCFRSAVGKQFYVNGECVVGGQRAAEWCQLSQAHSAPYCRFLHASSSNDALYALPLEEEHDGVRGQEENILSVEWKTDTVWMGDRSLSFVLPCGATVTLLQWRVNISSGGGYRGSGALAFLDIVWRLHPSEPADKPSRCVRIEGVSGSSTTRLLFDENDASGGATKVIARLRKWEIIRYVIPAQTNWSHVTSVAVTNASRQHPLRCTVGGMGFSSPADDHKVGDNCSVLLLGSAQELPDEAFSLFKTKEHTKRVVELEIPCEGRRGGEVLVFAKVNDGGCAPVCVYMGQHEARAPLLLALHTSPNAAVEKMFFYDVAPGS